VNIRATCTYFLDAFDYNVTFKAKVLLIF